MPDELFPEEQLKLERREVWAFTDTGRDVWEVREESMHQIKQCLNNASFAAYKYHKIKRPVG